MPPPDWTNERVIEFLELYSLEPAIWDPTDVNHKNLKSVRDAWTRISDRMDTPVEDLKFKKRSLMATFRPLLKKKKASIKNGADDVDVSQPIWFAFDLMESFLGPLYENETSAEDEPEPQPKETRNSRRNPCTPRTDDAKKTKPTATLKRPQRATSPFSEVDLAANINENLLNEVTDDEDCDLYAKLLAMKLKKYPFDMRIMLMYKIDGFLIDSPYPTDRQSAPDRNCFTVYNNALETEIPQRRRTRIKRDASEEIVVPGTATPTLFERTYFNASSDEDVKE